MKILSNILYKCAKIFWRVTKPVTAGTRIMLIKDNKALLVKHTYQEHWYLPGGGVKKGETFEEAIKREVKEELGGKLECIKLFGVYNNFYEYKNDHVVIFLSQNFSITGDTDKEIEAFDYFEIDNLPKNTSPGTRKRIEEYISGQDNNFGRW